MFDHYMEPVFKRSLLQQANLMRQASAETHPILAIKMHFAGNRRGAIFVQVTVTLQSYHHTFI